MINRTLLGISMLTCVAMAHAQDEMASARRATTALFAQADSYVNKGKLSKFYGMFAPGYYSVDTQGNKMWMSDFKAGMGGWMKSVKDIHAKTEIKNVQLMNDEEVVWTERVMTFKMKMNGRWTTMKETSRWAENLKMVNGKWMFASSQQLITNEPWSFKTTN